MMMSLFKLAFASLALGASSATGLRVQNNEVFHEQRVDNSVLKDSLAVDIGDLLAKDEARRETTEKGRKLEYKEAKAALQGEFLGTQETTFLEIKKMVKMARTGVRRDQRDPTPWTWQEKIGLGVLAFVVVVCCFLLDRYSGIDDESPTAL